MDLKLKNKVAVVTGGASGIGLATARLFATEGANLFLWDRADSVVSVAQDLSKEFGVKVAGIKVDVTDLYLSCPAVSHKFTFIRVSFIL